MKAILNLGLSLLLLIALLLTLYGTMKLTRNAEQSGQTVELSDGSSAVLTSSRSEVSAGTVSKILGVGVTGMLLSGAGLVLVQRKFKR